MASFIPDLVSDIRFYRVKKKKPITVQVLVGDDQAGGTVLHWASGTETFPGEDREPRRIGNPDEDLTNTFLDCTTTVQDIRSETNHTSVTIRLTGGIEPEEFSYEWEVDDRGIVIYSIEFFLTS